MFASFTMRDRLKVTTVGLDELGVKIALAYPEKSWQHLVLKNETDHHLLAVIIRYDITSPDDKSFAIREIICEPEVSLETDPEKMELLLRHRQVIAPHSTWLVGFGVDRIRFDGALPTYEEGLSLVAVEATHRPNEFAKHISVIIDGVILDDGRVIGPRKDEVRQRVADMLKARQTEAP